MELFQDKAGAELVTKLANIAEFFDSLASALAMAAVLLNNQMVMDTANDIARHLEQVFSHLSDPEQVTVGECYDFLFTAQGESVPFIVEVENRLSDHGILPTNDGMTPSEVLRELITA